MVTKTNPDINCCEIIVRIRDDLLMNVIWNGKNKEIVMRKIHKQISVVVKMMMRNVS